MHPEGEFQARDMLDLRQCERSAEVEGALGSRTGLVVAGKGPNSNSVV